MTLQGKKIAILATHGFEQSELEVPRQRLKDEGATVDVVSPESGSIRGWQLKDWGNPVAVDAELARARAQDYDALVLPGGQINPDLLRINGAALRFIRDIYEQNKLIAAVCHAPWLLIETGIIKGRRATSYQSIRTDVINAGANWEDAEVVVDRGVITSRNPGDLEAFSRAIIREMAMPAHDRRIA